MKYCSKCVTPHDDALQVCPVHGSALAFGLADRPEVPASNGSGCGVSVLVFVGIAIVRALFGGPSTSRPPAFPPPTFPPATFQQPGFPILPTLPRVDLTLPGGNAGTAALEVVETEWTAGEAGMEAVWRVKIRNAGTGSASLISYRIVYFSDVGNVVRAHDGEIEATVGAGATEWVEVRDGVMGRGAASAYFVLSDFRRVSKVAASR
jgi:hypothetical protein